MSDLTRFRDHCRKEARRPRVVNQDATGEVISAFGPTVSERALWKQLADEIDAYLDRPAEAVDLFGEITAEPARATEDA